MFWIFISPKSTSCGLVSAGKLAIILGDGVLIARRNLGRVSVADRPALALFEPPAQLQFEPIHLAHELLMHLLDESGIARETAGIEITHLIDQRLHLLLVFGIVLHCGTNLIEGAQSLINLALGVGRVLAWPRHRGRTGCYLGVAGVDVAVGRTASTAAPRTVVVDLTRLAALCHLTALTLSALSLSLSLALPLSLPALTLFALSLSLPGLTLFALTLALLALTLALLALARLTVAIELAGLELLSAGLPLTLLTLTLLTLTLLTLRVGTPA